jgi:hypothetical protein
MVLARSKRKVVEDEEDDDVQIVTPSAPKMKTTTKKVTKKTMMKEKEGETEEDKKHWKDADVEVMITLRGEMEPKFIKNAKNKGMSNVFVVQFFFQKKIRFQIGPIGPFKGLGLRPEPSFPPIRGQ